MSGRWMRSLCSSKRYLSPSGSLVTTPEVISIYVSLASSALGHRGLRHFHSNTGFARFYGHLQINRDKFYSKAMRYIHSGSGIDFHLVWSKNSNAPFPQSLQSSHHPLLLLHYTLMCTILISNEW